MQLSALWLAPLAAGAAGAAALVAAAARLRSEVAALQRSLLALRAKEPSRQ